MTHRGMIKNAHSHIGKTRRKRMSFRRSCFPFASAAILFSNCCPGFVSESKADGYEIKLGVISRFSDEAEAQVACRPDGVVWADSKSGFFYPKFLPEYGKTQHGAYTCYKQAEKADYWSFTPASDGGHKGREFPLFFCYACS